jgi:hypothetical protein
MTHRPTKFDQVLGDLTTWTPETRTWARQYISNHCARFHLLYLAELANCPTLLAEPWPIREELLDIVDLVDPQQLLHAWHQLEALRTIK